jgi:hypothetical protein
MSSPPHENAEMALWSQTLVDKFRSFVVGTTENSTLPRHAKFFAKRVEKATDN